MRKRLLKYGMILLTAFMLSVGMDLIAFAAEMPNISLHSINVEDNYIAGYFETTAEDFLPEISYSKAEIGGKDAKIVEIVRSEDKKVPKTIDVIIDISGSMDEERMNAACSTVKEFIDHMQEEDAMRITRMGNDRYFIDYTSDKEELSAFLEETSVTKEDTNFYKVLKEEVDELSVRKDIPSRRMIVVFSDGAEDQATGITAEEAMNAVKQSKIPVYAVALLKENPTEKQIEAAKIMGSFARESFAGKYIVPVLDQITTEEIYPLILNKINSQFIVVVDPWETLVGLESLQLKLKLSDGEMETDCEIEISDKVVSELFYDSDGNKKETEVTSEEKTETKSETKKETELPAISSETDESLSAEEEAPNLIKSILSNKIFVMIIIAAIFLLVILIVGLVILLKKKSTEQVQEIENSYAESNECIQITLVKQKTGETAASMDLYHKLSVGRGSDCDIHIEDNALSIEHGFFIRHGQEVYFLDNNSTNGSYINGMPVLGEKALKDGDVLLLGSDEYVINWR